MIKFLYFVAILVLTLAGLAALFYGLYILWKPLAYIIGGLILIFIAAFINQMYDDNTSERGEK